MAAKKPPKPIQIESGRWYAVAFGGEPFTEECCSCQLTHVVRYKVENGKFWVQYTVDDNLTRRARAQRKGR